jgi:hypothetical protein
MKTSISRLLLAPLAVLVLAGVALAPIAEAAPNKGGGGGNARAAGGGGGGGGAKPKAQVNNSKADVRTNNVRNTSVNNVNNNVNVSSNKNVNVNVDNNRGGCCNNGWDNDYHPIATAAAVTATVAVTAAVVGSIVNAPPPGCVPVNYGGMIYQQCGTVWYMPQGPQYVVINPPY